MAIKNLHELIQEFLEHLEIEKGRSQLTVRNYDHYLQSFLNWSNAQLGNETPMPRDISVDLVRKFRLHLSRRKGREGDYLQASTRNYYVIALRSFLKYLQKNDIKTLAPEKIELARQVRPQVSVLAIEKLEVMRRSPDLLTIDGLRDRAIIETLFATGLRVSELANLNKPQVNLNTLEFMVRGKGSKDRVVFLSEEAAQYLLDYFHKRDDTFDPVFLNHHTKPKAGDKAGLNLRLTSRSVERIIKKHALRAGIVEKITPHTLRHTFATDLLQAGADLRSVQEMLGHASVQTTQIYTHVTNRGLKAVHQKFHDRSKR